MNKHIFKLEEETNKVWNEETKSFEEFIELNKKENMEEREIKITLEQAKAMLEGENKILKELALSTFPELKRNKYPMSHMELQEILQNEFVSYISVDSSMSSCKLERNAIENRNIILSEKRAKEIQAFTQVIALADYWNNEVDKFTPDWEENTKKYIITNWKNEVDKDFSWIAAKALYFKTEETRDLFLETFRDLIEECKNLI